jgi:hypothetical protein
LSLFVDLKYLQLIGNQLPMFKKKKDNLYNCRCILCGDSSTKKNKARGYFYSVKNEMFYKCHNCSISQHFGTFLKNFNAMLYNEYVLERYSEGLPSNKPHQKAANSFIMPEPKFNKSKSRLLDDLLDRLDTLPSDNEAVEFCAKRKIPKEMYSKLYYIENIKDIVQLNSSYKDQIKSIEPRLVIPFYDSNGQLAGATCRALRNESLRYVTIKIKEENLLVFGLDCVDKNKTVYVTEGPIDSLFLPNAIAVSGTTFGKLQSVDVPKEKMVVIFDNQPRNKEVCKLLDKVIQNDYNVVIWPQNLTAKDINDIVLEGKDPLKIINKNIFRGLEAKIKFTEWKRC